MILLLLLQFVFGNVITANHKNFQEIVLKSNHVVMVEFFAPWCGHCKNLAPEYAKAASKLKGLAKLVAVDCDNSVNRELCSRYGVQGFPTLKIFSAGKKGLATDYNGERTAKAIVDTITPMIPGRYVTKIGGTAKKAVTLEQFQNDKSLAQVVLVTDKKTTPTLFKALSIEYLDRLFFGEVKSSSKDIVETLGISSFPTILVFTKEGEKVVYDGPIKQEKVVAFLEQYAGPPLVKSKPSKVKPKKEKEPKKEQRAPCIDD